MSPLLVLHHGNPLIGFCIAWEICSAMFSSTRVSASAWLEFQKHLCTLSKIKCWLISEWELQTPFLSVLSQPCRRLLLRNNRKRWMLYVGVCEIALFKKSANTLQAFVRWLTNTAFSRLGNVFELMKAVGAWKGAVLAAFFTKFLFTLMRIWSTSVLPYTSQYPSSDKYPDFLNGRGPYEVSHQRKNALFLQHHMKNPIYRQLNRTLVPVMES